MRLIFATGNKNKLEEVRSIAPRGFDIVGLEEMGFRDELPETSETIEGNSLQKAAFLSRKFNVPCFAEDTGLIVDALNGAPGVYSARYAGPQATAADNMSLLLRRMMGISDRTARFKTVFTYFSGDTFVQFEGITEGEILREPAGDKGFGYDPVFRPLGSDRSYAEMVLIEKNRFSHRKKSFDQLANHLLGLRV